MVTFEDLLAQMQHDYPRIEVVRPYQGSGYLEFYRDGEDIGGFNPDGYNLLYCMRQLVKIYAGELR